MLKSLARDPHYLISCLVTFLNARHYDIHTNLLPDRSGINRSGRALCSMSNVAGSESLLPSELGAAARSPSSDHVLTSKSKRSIRPLLALLVLVHLAAVLYTLPLNRVIELRLCQEHYELHDPSVIPQEGAISEKLCKIDMIQRRLAWLQGVMETTLVVCGACDDCCTS